MLAFARTERGRASTRSRAWSRRGGAPPPRSPSASSASRRWPPAVSDGRDPRDARSSRRRSSASSASSGWRARRSRSRWSRDPELAPAGPSTRLRVLAAGPGQPAQPLAKVASGGELSRTMLACRSVLVDLDDVPTLVFDEVDAGIGGQAGVAVGRAPREPRARRQVVVVTHLPQIASFADRHIRVRKDAGPRGRGAGRRRRVEELSRMLARAPRERCARSPTPRSCSRAGRRRHRPRSPAVRGTRTPPTTTPLPLCRRGDPPHASPGPAGNDRPTGPGPRGRPESEGSRRASTFGTKPRSLLRRPLRRPGRRPASLVSTSRTKRSRPARAGRARSR